MSVWFCSVQVLPVSTWLCSGFSSFFQPPKNMLGGGLADMPVVWMCVCVSCPDIDWYPRFIPVYSHPVPSVPGIGSGSSITLTRIKWLLKMNEFICWCCTHRLYLLLNLCNPDSDMEGSAVNVTRQKAPCCWEQWYPPERWLLLFNRPPMHLYEGEGDYV